MVIRKIDVADESLLIRLEPAARRRSFICSNRVHGATVLRQRARLRPVEINSRLERLSPSEPGVVAASVYVNGRRVSDISIEEAGDWSRRSGHVVWIGLHEPDKALLERVAAQLNLHPLAIEDASNAHQQTNVE